MIIKLHYNLWKKIRTKVFMKLLYGATSQDISMGRFDKDFIQHVINKISETLPEITTKEFYHIDFELNEFENFKKYITYEVAILKESKKILIDYDKFNTFIQKQIKIIDADLNDYIYILRIMEGVKNENS